ncbi:hypothetical protein A3709_03480 [Halioglobus sp. HI00S01]|nr:hypothetical protein A3709_03480 [Halioglobus sp. HI00S01]
MSLDEWEDAVPVRVVAFHRSEMQVATEDLQLTVPLHKDMPKMVVGDWVLLDAEQRLVRLLDRKPLFQRRAAGTEMRSQLIAANVDTALGKYYKRTQSEAGKLKGRDS